MEAEIELLKSGEKCDPIVIIPTKFKAGNPLQPKQRPEDFIETLPRDHDTSFWESIRDLQWRNKSDGPADMYAVNKLIRLWKTTGYPIVAIYHQYYDNMLESVIKRGLVASDDFEKQSLVVSHAIGLGRDQYNTLLCEDALFEFLIEADECQDLDSLLLVPMQKHAAINKK